MKLEYRWENLRPIIARNFVLHNVNTQKSRENIYDISHSIYLWTNVILDIFNIQINSAMLYRHG